MARRRYNKIRISVLMAAPLAVMVLISASRLSLAQAPDAAENRSAALHGRVYDAISKQPLSAAAVIWEPSGTEAAKASTDKQGGYQLVVDSGAGTLRVEAPGHPRFSSPTLVIEPGSRRQYDAWILPAFDCTGTVVDAKGNPVAGVELIVDLNKTTPAALVDSIERYPVYAAKRLSAKSGADGSFKLGPLLNAIGWRLDLVSVDAPPLSVAIDPAKGSGMRLQLPPAGEIRGKLIGRDDQPLAGATVTVSEPLRSASASLPTVTTDASGLFRLRPLAAGSWSVTIDPPGSLEEVFDRIKLGRGETRDLGTIRARPGTTLSGKMVDSHGDPIAKATIKGLRRVGSFTKIVRTAVSAADGAFKLDGLSGEEIDIAVRPEAPFLDKDIAHQRLDTGSLEIELQRGGSIEGEIVASDGAPLAQPVVTAMLIDSKRDERIREAGKLEWLDRPRGKFRVNALPEGTYQIVGRAAGRRSASTDRLDLVSEGTLSAIRLELERGLTVDGLVVDAASRRGVAGAAVSVAGRDELATTSDESGRFHLEGLERGAQNLIATQRDYAPGSVSITIGDRPPESLAIELSKGASLQGKVSDRTAAPVPNVAIQVSGKSAPSGTRTVTGVDGRYRFEHLAPGRLTVERVGTRAADSGDSKSVDLVDGETAEVDFTLGNVLEGTVTKSGAPADGVVIQVVSAPAEWEFSNGPVPRVVTTGVTSNDGTFRLEGVGVGRTTISLMFGAQTSTRIVELVDAPTQRRDFQLPTRPLHLSVIDKSTGKPLVSSGSQVSYSGVTRSSWMSTTSGSDERGDWAIRAGGSDQESTSASSQGMLDLFVDAARPTTVVAFASGYETESKELPPGANPVALELALSKSINITVKLLPEGGGTIREARVCLVSESIGTNGSPNLSSGCSSGDSDRFEFDVPPDSSANHLNVSAAGFVSVTRDLGLPSKIEPGSRIDIILAPAGKLLVSLPGAIAPEIVKIEKEPGVDLFAIAQKAEAVTAVPQADRQGLMIDGLPLGELTVTYKLGGAERVATVRIENGKVTELRIK